MHFAYTMQCGVSFQSSTCLVDRALSQVECQTKILNRPMCSEGSELTHIQADRGGMHTLSLSYITSCLNLNSNNFWQTRTNPCSVQLM
jgi:hypothetical protein